MPDQAVRELLETIARSLVDEPDAVDVRAVERDESLLLELRVAADDLGKVIGKQGRTARSIRTLLAHAGDQRNQRIDFEILD